MATDAKKDGAADGDESAKDADKRSKNAPTGGRGGKVVLGAVILNTVLSGAALALGVKASLGAKAEPKRAQASAASTEREPAEEAPAEEAPAEGDHANEAGKETDDKARRSNQEDAPAKDEDREKAEAPASEQAEGKPPSGEAKGAAPGGAKAAGADSKDGRGPVVRIENVVVHLRNPELDRFARLTVEYELASQADLGKFEAAVPLLRDGIITTVADRTFEQLAGAAGINALKRDLLEQASKRGRVRVRAAYLTDFVIQ